MPEGWVQTASGRIPSDIYETILRSAKSQRDTAIFVSCGTIVMKYVVPVMVAFMLLDGAAFLFDFTWLPIGTTRTLVALGVLLLSFAFSAKDIRKLEKPELQPYIDRECRNWRRQFGEHLDDRYRDEQIEGLETALTLDGPSEPV